MNRQPIIERFDVPGPRYSSYPTADRFGADFGPQVALAALQPRAADPAPLSPRVALTCRGRTAFGADARRDFAPAVKSRALADAGLVMVEPNALQVTATGWSVLCAIASVFDGPVQHDPAAPTRSSEVA